MSPSDRESIWRSPGCYEPDHEPDPYVLSHGLRFLRRHCAPRSTLVDFGCWRGRHLEVLARVAGAEGRVVGIDGDWASEQLADARRRHPRVDVRAGALAQLSSFEDDSVGGGLCWRVLHNLTAPGELEGALRELRRVLEPGAPLLAAVRRPRHEGDTPRAEAVLHRSEAGGRARRDLYFTRTAVTAVFGEHGFEVQDIEAIEGWDLVGASQVRVKNRYFAVQLRRASAQ